MGENSQFPRISLRPISPFFPKKSVLPIVPSLETCSPPLTDGETGLTALTEKSVSLRPCR